MERRGRPRKFNHELIIRIYQKNNITLSVLARLFQTSPTTIRQIVSA